MEVTPHNTKHHTVTGNSPATALETGLGTMSNTYPAGTVFEVCECCTVTNHSGGDDSGCRDYHEHTHRDGFIPTECVYSGDSGQEYIAEWLCDACGEWQPDGSQLHYWTAQKDTSGPYSLEWEGQ